MLRRADELTTDWLSRSLGGAPVTSFVCTRIGTGQVSDCHRVELEYAQPTPGAPASVVLKLASSNETSRQTGAALGLYEREVGFYRDIAPRLGEPVAGCHVAQFDATDTTFCLLLDDAGAAQPGDDIAGATRARAQLAVRGLAALHAPLLGDAQLQHSDWLQRESPITQDLMRQLFNGFAERYASRVAPEHHVVCDRLVSSFDGWVALAHDGPQGLVHGDYRLDNMLFATDGADATTRPLTVVDWQTVGWGDSLTDLAYFLGCALPIADRRAWSAELVGAYHAGLGAGGPSLDECLDGVRRQSFFGVMMAIISPMLVQRTERGDDMFMTVLERHAQQVLDLDALDVLPAPVHSAPLRPATDDEGPHPPGDERLWNESWYLDVADAQREIGLYVRLGAYPNLDRSWYTAMICGPGRPTVAVTDFHAPLPGDDLALRTAAIDATHAALEPLQRYRVTLRATGEAHDDPSAPLRGEPGRPVDVTLDLVWETDGEPYQYRMTTRYEIPCRVHGTLTVDGETIAIDAPGQRDHSWGVRDWWAMDWVWFSGRLDDGSALHAVDLRIPGAPRIGIGYAQTPGAPLTELDRVGVTETISGDGLPLDARLQLAPGDLDVAFAPLGHGPLLLTDDDGRVAQFPRAWGRLTTADGRAGVGWIEFNRNLAR